MKLLLTSSGLTNQSLANAMFDLVGKKPEDIAVVVIPTAATIVTGDKSWFINDLLNLKKQNFKSIEIMDISAVDPSIWKPCFQAADVLFFEGGDTFHLMEWLNQSGLSEELPELLKTKVWVGVSAGSMVTNKTLLLNIAQSVYGEDLERTEEMPGLNFVNFYFLPHLNSPDFPNLREDFIRHACKGMTEKIFALDDQSALKVINEKVEVISEGAWFAIN